LLTFLCVNSQPRIDDLDDMIRTYGQTVIGRIAKTRGALGTLESGAEAVEAGHEGDGSALAWRRLLDLLCGRRNRRRRRYFGCGTLLRCWRRIRIRCWR